MNQPLPPDSNQSSSPEPGIWQQVENSVLGGGIQSILGNNNNQSQQIINIFLQSATEKLLQQLQEHGINFHNISSNQPPDLSIPRIVEKLSRRLETVTDLKNIYSNKTWIAIDGISGSGKKHLAVLLIKAIGSCAAWIKFRGLNIKKATQHLDESLKAITNLKTENNRYKGYLNLCESLEKNTVLVLENLPQLSGNDELSERLIQLTQACNYFGVKLLSTSPHQLPLNLQERIGEKNLYSVKAPPLKDSEAAEILLAYEAPTSIIDHYTKFFNTLAMGNPPLIVVIARYLRHHNWQMTENIEEKLLTGDYLSLLESQTVIRILDSIEDKDSRELLYRLCLPIGSFSRKEVKAVASVDPPIEMAIERLYSLVGLWVEPDVNERFLLSPIVQKFGNDNVLLETQKKCYELLANIITSKHKVTILDIEKALIYYINAEDFNRAGITLISALSALYELSQIDYDSGSSGRLLSLWGSLPLPEQMALDYRLIIRKLQINLQYKYSKPIDYLISNLDTLLKQAGTNNALSVISATMSLQFIFSQKDSLRANSYLRMALKFLPYIQKSDNNDLALPNTEFLSFAIWTTVQATNTIEKLQDWINTVEQLTIEQRQFAFTHAVAELGCLIVSEKLWLQEDEKPKQAQKWTEVFEAYVDLADRAWNLSLELLWGCAICSQIIIRAYYYQNDINAAISITEAALEKASSEPRVQFLIKSCIGRQLVNAHRNNEAVEWLNQALRENTHAYPLVQIKANLSMSRAIGEQNSLSAAVEFAQKAVNLAQDHDEIDGISLVKAIVETAIAQWLFKSDDINAVFQFLDKALLLLLNCKSNTDDWKILFAAFGHVTGYFTSIACTGKPPLKTRSGEDYATPERGMFSSLNSQLVNYYNRNLEYTVLANLANFAESLNIDERAKFWYLKSIDDAKLTNEYGAIECLYLKFIPYLLDDKFPEVLPLAMKTGLFLNVLIQQENRFGELPENLELDMGHILPNQPTELLLKAEQFAVLFGLIPAAFNIAIIAVYNIEYAKRKAENVVSASRKISETAVDSYIWVTAAELLEQIYSQESTHDGIVRYTKKNYQNFSFLTVIGYLVATLQHDILLPKAVFDHLVIAPFLYNEFIKHKVTYRLIILKFFVDYWRNKFQKMPCSFRSYSLIHQILSHLETIPEEERLQTILCSVAFSLNVSIPEHTKEWIYQSSPNLVKLLEN